LKWPRLIAFQLVGALSIAVTGISARSFVDLNHDRAKVRAMVPGGQLHATDVVTVTAIMTTAGGLCGLYCFALFNIVLYKLQKVETRRSILIKESLYAFFTLFFLGASIAATVIIVPRSAKITSTLIPEAVLKPLVAASGQSLAYRDALVFPAMIVSWICFGANCVAFALTSMAARHIHKYGSEPTFRTEHEKLNNQNASAHDENGH